jgi:mannose-6-phosphate isomerase-like protein (cupin superfamily)
MGFSANVQELALANTDFRRVLHTTPLSQLVLMSVQPGDDIGLETHHLDQVLVFVSGRGESLLANQRGTVGPGSVVVVPAGTEHNFVNTGSEPLKLFTVYAPPEHADGTVHKTKADAEEAEAAEHGHAPPEPARLGGGYSVGSLKRTPQA